MIRRAILFLFLLLGVIGISALWLGPSSVLIRFVHHDFPGGSLMLAGNKPISLEQGTGGQHFVRWISSDSSITFRCNSGDRTSEERMGYLTPSLFHYVVLDVVGCTVKQLDISWFP
jgi:hypothetical protein